MVATGWRLGAVLAVGLLVACTEQAQVDRHRARAEGALRRGDAAEATGAFEAAYRAARKDQVLRGDQARALADHLATLRRPAEAEPYAREAVAIAEKTLRPDAPEVGRRQVLLGRILYLQEQFGPAESSLARGCQVLEGSGEMLFGNMLLASTRVRLGKFEEAERTARKGTALRSADAKGKAMAWNALAEVYREWNRLPEAIEASRESVRVLGQTQGRMKAGMLNDLAWTLAKGGVGPEAERHARTALQVLEDSQGEARVRAGYLDTLAYALLVSGKLAEAEAIARKAVSLVDGEELPDQRRFYAHSTLARILAAQGRVIDAVAAFQVAEALGAKAPRPHLAQLLEDYARLLRGESREAEAEVVEERLRTVRLPAAP